MNGPTNGRYRRRFTNPEQWPSNQPFGAYAEKVTQQRVNELAWELEAENLAREIETVLNGGPKVRRGDPGGSFKTLGGRSEDLQPGDGA